MKEKENPFEISHISFVNKSYEDDEEIITQKNESKENEIVVKPIEPPLLSFFRAFRFADQYDYILIVIGIIGSIFTGLSAPANTSIFGELTNALVNVTKEEIGGNIHCIQKAIDNFALKNSLIGLALLILSYVSLAAFGYAAQRQIYKIRMLYFQSALRQDVGWYDLNNTGDFASRMSEDLNKLEDGIGEKCLYVAHSMSAFISCIVLALVEGWKLALISVSSLPVIIMVIGLITFVSGKLSKNELEAYAKAGSIATEVLSSIRTVIAFGGQEKELKRFDKHLEEARSNNVRRKFFNGLSFGLLWFLIYSTYGLAFYFGIKMVFDGEYAPGKMITVFFSVIVGAINFLIMMPFLEVFANAKAAVSRVFYVIDRKSAIDPNSNEGFFPTSIEGNIEFKDVEFHYPSRPNVPILKGISMKINKGETVALVGSSGCGKSTCIQLIQRFYDTIKGQILIDGQDIKNLNVRHLRQHLGVVGQEPVLFATSISENIRYSNEAATMEEIITAAKMANAHDFISKLPRGYETLVGEKGAQLSGGQKQRVAIARALVRNPRILLLDEATSALDNASEAKVQVALDKALKGRTTIIVAHRLSTIRQADKIIVLSKGEIVEDGTHEELVAKKNHYFDLVNAQTQTFGENEKNPTDEELHDEDEINLMAYQRNSVSNTAEEFVDSKSKNNEVTLLEILKLNSPEWKSITIATVFSMLVGFSSPFFSIVFGDIMAVLKEKDSNKAMNETIKYCWYFVGIGILMGMGTFITVWAYGLAGEALTKRLRYLSFDAMLKQEMAWFDDKLNSVGALSSRLSNDSSNVQGATGQPIGSVVQGIATIGLSISFAMFFQWKLGLVTLAFTPFLFAGSFFMTKTLKDDGKIRMAVLEKSNKIAIEAVGNIKTVANLGRENSFCHEYETKLKSSAKIIKRGVHFRAITMGISRSLMFFAYSVCMYYGKILMIEEKVSYQNILKVTQTLIMASFSLANAFAFAPNFQNGLISANNIFRLLKRVPKIQDSVVANENIKWEAKGNVTYKNISFKYPSRPNSQILKNFNLEVKKGKNIALVGQSGCGKSTLIQLLERFYDPDEGELLLDSERIKDLKMRVLRKSLGIVSQEPVLFDRTIAENIAYGDNEREISMDEIIEAAKQANIHNFIANLPLGYTTGLGEKGTQLSGGQKQRVAIARALIRQPKVLLLDEATSALDTQSEKLVQKALDKASKGRTCITIAHRLSTIQDSDLIVVVNKGQVAEMGTHTELMAKKGLYRQLCLLQGK